ncbi:hypothetical protein TREMEDRAFT_29921 [Tremella mesenterica DSM 1558]|uniref:uncharacterized protein n=1 Tax=Tremella mesenterica (strain ATCC 24925 / CBS 8224 / DSM 1558 / NBRC 9311 / NRRL Y-6157 / RJB 2259-6 / UBC 559-6) TaxID=578456 RepID=UPI0003F4A18E|nr:uncharacterized protein TREMEDRAFT_29921 [Tremella mesenterica DSM 1558]EIW69855.1 hypothetical protein TREMEDRAFT_29921 [Tremella mesenterica DSM 1558]
MSVLEATEGIDKPTAGPSKPRKRFVGSTKPSNRPRRVANLVPDDILHDPVLNAAIEELPKNYNFEIHKTIHLIRRDGVKIVALQMPEGLMMYGCLIADIVEQFTGAIPLLLADVTYGACCIDDFTAKELGAEMIVHYGHSCLIPVNQTSLKTLYVFVEIAIDTEHLALSVRRNFPSSRSAFHEHVLGAEETTSGSRIHISIEPPDLPPSRTITSSLTPATESTSPSLNSNSSPKEDDIPTHLALVSTIQFVAAVQYLRTNLESPLPPIESLSLSDENDAIMHVPPRDRGVWRGQYKITVPQVKPLSPGEVLGCTAPKLSDVDALIYVGDGRFHLESIMIANPTVPAFRYDPYSKKFTRETYEHGEMRSVRGDAVQAAKRGLDRGGPGSWAIVLGTLGRQGSLSVLKTIQNSMPEGSIPPFMLLLSELSPQKLALLSEEEITTFVQTSCPRLSIDWGYAFSRPLLSPYEASVALGRIRGWGGLKWDDEKREEGKGDYPMDYYSDTSLGPWTPRYQPPKVAKIIDATACYIQSS